VKERKCGSKNGPVENQLKYFVNNIKIHNVTFIDDFNGRKSIGVAIVIRFKAALVDTALAGVGAGCRARPEDLFCPIAVIPVAVLGRVELERNRQRVKLYVNKLYNETK